MPATGRLDVHPPPLHSELSVSSLSAVDDDVWAVGMCGAPAPALIAHSTDGQPWQVVSNSSSSKAVHTQLAGVHAAASGDVWAVGWEGLLLSNTTYPHCPQRWDDVAAGRESGFWRWQPPIRRCRLGSRRRLRRGCQGLRLVVTKRVGWPSAGRRVGRHSGRPLGRRQVGGCAQPRPRNVPRGLCGRSRCILGGRHHRACRTSGQYFSGGPLHRWTLAADQLRGDWAVVWRGRGWSPDDVWAVGQDQDPGDASGALILHYDGHAWAPTETPVVGQAALSSVACSGPDNVWAVGAQQRQNGAFGPLILHFDGSEWAAVEPPATAAPKSLSAVITLPDGTAWAAGLLSGAGDTGYTIPLHRSTGRGH